MADSLSTFFSSLLPDFRPREQPAPTRLVTETRTVGSSPARSQTATPAATAEGAAAAAAAGPSGEAARSTEPAIDSEEIRRRREQFLDKNFGKRKGAKGGRPAASRVGS